MSEPLKRELEEDILLFLAAYYSTFIGGEIDKKFAHKLAETLTALGYRHKSELNTRAKEE